MGERALKYGELGYMEEDVSPMLYAITFSVLGAAIVVVFLRYGSLRFAMCSAAYLTTPFLDSSAASTCCVLGI